MLAIYINTYKDKEHDSPPWTLVHNVEEPELAPSSRPAKKARSSQASHEDKEAVAAMIGSLDSIAARLESIQERPDLVCKRKAHMRDPEESSRPPAKWRARCGWPYGYSNFTRAHDDGSQNLCLKCFPEVGAESRKKAAGQQPSDTESTDSYVVMDTGLRALLLDAGASDDLIAYVATKGILSTAIFAEMGEDVKEFDQAMVQPLASPFKLQDGKVFEVSDAELPVARARLRHAWRKAREKSAPNTASSSPTTTAAAVTATSKTKELPPGYWQQQIHKYEAVLIHGVPRKFPEMTLLGAEAVIAKLLNDAKNFARNAIPLEEIVQHRHFTAALLPNNLSSARKRARSQEQVTTLVVNADLQLEAEPETPWKPKSQVAILDCLEAVRVALIFIEYAPESDIDEYFSWWQRLVRSRPNKIDQLKIHWENTSWRIALALRKKQPFRDIAHEIMADSQLLQEAMSTEAQPDRPARAPKNTDILVEAEAEARVETAKASSGGGSARKAKGMARVAESIATNLNTIASGTTTKAAVANTRKIAHTGKVTAKVASTTTTDRNGARPIGDSSTSPLPRSRRSPDDDKKELPQPVTLRSKAETIRIKNGDRPPDIVLLSFFDGLGTACLICDEHCSSNGLQWRGASWEIDPNLKKLLHDHFPDVVQRGDFDQETPESLHNLVQELDPTGRATVVIAGGPPCHDFSRIRSDAPGHQGTEGSKFARFAQLVVDLEKRWQRPRAVVMVENVIPQNRADMRKIEKSLDSPAVVHDAADFGAISRPRVWWCRVPWQEIAHRSDCPLRIRWSTMQGIPRVHFDLVKDDPHAFKTEGLSLPRCLVEEGKPLPCLTTFLDDPQGRPAPRSSKGKISSEANQRWRADRQRFAPWHYEAGVMMADSQGRFVIPPPSVKEQWHHLPPGVMMADSQGRFVIPPPSVKEQWHHLPPGWTSKLSEHERHKALANGWHAGAARLIFIMAMFAATPAMADKELNPLGGTALDIAAGLWQGRPPLLGPGPGDYDSFDLSYLQDPAEHWKLSRHMPHPDHRDAFMEPGLQQWIRIWVQMRAHLAELRLAVVEQVEEMVVEMEDETKSWYQSLRPHVQKAYRSTTGVCTLQLPALRRICELFGWQDLDIFDELTQGFRLLGPLAPGLGWKRRNDDRYANPLDLAEFMVKNKQYVVDNFRRCRVDPCWKQMADEIAADVSLGRMEGPFTSPPDWPKSAVPLASHEHTSKLLEGPREHQPTCFAFAVHQVGSDGRPKVRRAEDWRRSFANVTVAAEDSPPYHDVNSYVQLVRAIKEIDPQAEILIWGLDHESAYRQLPPVAHLRGSRDARRSDSLVIQGVDILVSHESVTVHGTEERRQRLDEALADVLTQVARTLQLFGPCFAELDSQVLVVIIAIGDSMDRFAMGSAHSVLYADAFFNLFDKDWKPSDEDIPNWGRTPPETLRNGWGFVVTVQRQTYFAHGRVPYWFVRAFTSRRAYIYMLEIVAQILPLFAMEDQLSSWTTNPHATLSPEALARMSRSTACYNMHGASWKNIPFAQHGSVLRRQPTSATPSAAVIFATLEPKVGSNYREIGTVFSKNFCCPPLSTGQLSPSCGHGTAVDFPAGTRILVPMNIAMTDKEVWGVDAFEFNPSRPGLQERNMVFANVGAAGSRVCPGAGIAIDTCVKILQVLGEVRRSHRHNS
ncbi:kanC [Symbiodinium sp. CCMP2592]|nr:kanC [Symbiodinium sp. CCMP2592]